MTGRPKGFTLVELMVAMAVLAILLVMAIPSFNDFRRRAVMRGAADQISSFWGDAKFEAVRRNTMVKVGFVTDAAKGVCLGAATTTDRLDDTACDCFTASACNVARFPVDQGEWRGVRALGFPDMGGGATDEAGVSVIDPKRGSLTDPADTGGITLQSAAGGQNYQLKVVIDRNGRAVQCQPANAPAKLPQFTSRTCES